MDIVKGLYRHNKTQKLYNVIGVGRSVTNPTKLVVVYEQLYDSKLRCDDINADKDINTDLPIGSIWIRDLHDFTSIDNNIPKFSKV